MSNHLNKVRYFIIAIFVIVAIIAAICIVCHTKPKIIKCCCPSSVTGFSLPPYPTGAPPPILQGPLPAPVIPSFNPSTDPPIVGIRVFFEDGGTSGSIGLVYIEFLIQGEDIGSEIQDSISIADSDFNNNGTISPPLEFFVDQNIFPTDGTIEPSSIGPGTTTWTFPATNILSFPYQPSDGFLPTGEFVGISIQDANTIILNTELIDFSIANFQNTYPPSIQNITTTINSIINPSGPNAVLINITDADINVV